MKDANKKPVQVKPDQQASKQSTSNDLAGENPIIVKGGNFPPLIKGEASPPIDSFPSVEVVITGLLGNWEISDPDASGMVTVKIDSSAVWTVARGENNNMARIVRKESDLQDLTLLGYKKTHPNFPGNFSHKPDSAPAERHIIIEYDRG